MFAELVLVMCEKLVIAVESCPTRKSISGEGCSQKSVKVAISCFATSPFN
jgi:hypothetical protein